MPIKETVQEALDMLEAQGLLRKTGKFRRGRSGELQAVYVATPLSIRLSETDQTDQFLATLNQTENRTELLS